MAVTTSTTPILVLDGDPISYAGVSRPLAKVIDIRNKNVHAHKSDLLR